MIDILLFIYKAFKKLYINSNQSYIDFYRKQVFELFSKALHFSFHSLHFIFDKYLSIVPIRFNFLHEFLEWPYQDASNLQKDKS